MLLLNLTIGCQIIMEHKGRPLIPVNTEGLDDIAAALLNNPGEEGNGEDPPGNLQLPRNLSTPEKYVLLPAKSYGSSYSYPNTLISLERMHNGKNWFDS